MVQSSKETLSSLRLRVLCTRFDYIGCFFSDCDDRRNGVPANLVWEYRRVDDAEALNAEHAEIGVDSARLRRSTNTCGGRLRKLVVSHTRDNGDKTARTHGVERGAAAFANVFLYLLVRNLHSDVVGMGASASGFKKKSDCIRTRSGSTSPM